MEFTRIYDSVNCTHESLSAGAFSPQCRSPFFLQAEFLKGFLDNTSWSCEGEFDNELGQMQMADWVLLSWNTSQWTIDEDLEVNKRAQLRNFFSRILSY